MTSSAATAVPASVDALLALLRAAPSLKDVAVLDGEWIDAPSQHKDVVVIGWIPDEGYTIEWAVDPASLAAGDDAESFAISGWVSVNRGSTEIKKARDAACTIFDEVRAVVRANMTLNGAVSRAYVSAASATPFEDEQGTAFSVSFVVTINVF